MHLAERTMFVGMAKLLWAFDFDKCIDPLTGSPIEPDTDPISGYSGGAILVAKPFPCEITPRSVARQDTIMREFSRAETDIFSKYETIDGDGLV
jgi:cytochrome P450 family 619